MEEQECNVILPRSFNCYLRGVYTRVILCMMGVKYSTKSAGGAEKFRDEKSATKISETRSSGDEKLATKRRRRKVLAAKIYLRKEVTSLRGSLPVVCQTPVSRTGPVFVEQVLTDLRLYVRPPLNWKSAHPNGFVTTDGPQHKVVRDVDRLPFASKIHTLNTQMSAAALIFSATALLRRLFGCGALLSAALIFFSHCFAAALIRMRRSFGTYIFQSIFKCRASNFLFLFFVVLPNAGTIS